jgi:hypothetical protein
MGIPAGCGTEAWLRTNTRSPTIKRQTLATPARFERDVVDDHEAHGTNIVQTYADDGKSGLNVEGRGALQPPIANMERGTAPFEVNQGGKSSRWFVLVTW